MVKIYGLMGSTFGMLITTNSFIILFKIPSGLNRVGAENIFFMGATFGPMEKTYITHQLPTNTN